MIARGRIITVLILLILILLSAGFFVFTNRPTFSRSTIQKTTTQLRSDDTAIQLQALHFVAEWPADDRLRADVEALMTSPNADVRLSVARALGKYRDQDAANVLLVLARDADPQVAEEANRQLDKVRRSIEEP